MLAGFGNDGSSGFEGCRSGRVVGTYLHGPLLPRNPWFADWILAEAAGAPAREPPVLEPLERRARDSQAHGVSASAARTRGGRF